MVVACVCVWFGLELYYPVFLLTDVSGDTLSSFEHEVPEKAMLFAHVHPYDRVIEVGTNIGSTCIFVGQLLSRPEQSLCVEPNPSNYARLKDNIHLAFPNPGTQIGTLSAIISRRKSGNISMVYRGIATRVAHSGEKGDIEVPIVNISLARFNVFILDCEGCFCEFLEDFPEALNARLLLIEEDGRCDYSFEQLLDRNGFARVDGSLRYGLFASGFPRHSVWMKHAGNVQWRWLWHESIQFCHTVRTRLKVAGWAPTIGAVAAVLGTSLSFLSAVCILICWHTPAWFSDKLYKAASHYAV
eukprot:CAMPEP_0198601214 /NCGR_PEP_ID=MMETSP1462-20131121/149246_1 /TAXON_ID=1333877 /ORGANISM="Brandtodinium nutriculum, Strain RCC3387" /LENGTH=299 /DNA_ID=CAMNT_0044332941 /DNA_START=34 /DNA_END=933 /DNA_ORIENTATION=+